MLLLSKELEYLLNAIPNATFILFLHVLTMPSILLSHIKCSRANDNGTYGFQFARENSQALTFASLLLAKLKFRYFHDESPLSLPVISVTCSGIASSGQNSMSPSSPKEPLFTSWPFSLIRSSTVILRSPKIFKWSLMTCLLRQLGHVISVEPRW